MKIRIKGNSLRLRLSQPEVARLQSDNRIKDSINFGYSKLSYQIGQSNIPSIVVKFENNLIDIEVPKTVITSWSNPNEVGFNATVKVSDEESLYILVEKDFKCLTDREHEDESDLFENPAMNNDC